MAKVIPFMGVHYNQKKIKDFAEVATPPYDVISKQEQKDFHKKHVNNIIRLILGENGETDEKNHADAAQYYNKWLDEQILIRDNSKTFYLTSVEFSVSGKKITRYGLTALVGLEPFEKGIVLPHEKTFSRVKSERLGLMKKCHANFSPVFSLYHDNDGVIFNKLKNVVSGQLPDFDFTDSHGQTQKLWKITDKDVHNEICEAMKEKRIFIADGHHRYETALNYRDWVAKNSSDFNADHPANYIMMSLTSMDDPGLVILPAHRLLTGVDDLIIDKLISKAKIFFDINRISCKDKETALKKFTAGLNTGNEKNIIGLFMKNQPNIYLMTLKPDVMEQRFGDELPDAVRNLDVTVLTRLIFMEISGFNQAMLDDEKMFSYTTDLIQAFDKVETQKCDIAFILNPTKIEQVKNIAEAKLVMPRKSTYFYPKVITGQVLNSLLP